MRKVYGKGTDSVYAVVDKYGHLRYIGNHPPTHSQPRRIIAGVTTNEKHRSKDYYKMQPGDTRIPVVDKISADGADEVEGGGTDALGEWWAWGVAWKSSQTCSRSPKAESIGSARAERNIPPHSWRGENGETTPRPNLPSRVPHSEAAT